MTKILEIDGLPVIDAKKAVRLIVTPNDIARADVKRPSTCAVARACRRELNAAEVRVHLSRVYIRVGKDSWTRYATPRDMRSEIIAFDRGGQFEPGEFSLAAPCPSKRLGKRRGSDKPQPARGRGKKRKPPSVVKNVRLGPAA